MGGDESHFPSLPSAHRVMKDTGIPFVEPPYSRGITSANQGYVQMQTGGFILMPETF